MAMNRRTPLTRSLLAACSIVALSAVMYGCSSGGGDDAPAVEQPDPDAEVRAIAAAQASAQDAWFAARDAVASIADTDAEPAAQQRAVNALADARAAYNAALAATTSAEAASHQTAAEAARDMATQQVAMVVAARDAGAIMAAGAAAKMAADGAKASYDAAKVALAGVEAFKSLDMTSYDAAAAQVAVAKMAYDAAMAASTAAAGATLLGDARSQQMAAETAMANAAAANKAAMGLVAMVQTAEDNALAAARTAANDAYGAVKTTAASARQAADDASAEADAAEAANVGSPAAKDSRTAADAAATAATAAEDAAMAASEAKMAADDAATSAGAKGHQATAEAKKGEAEGHLTTAQMKLADAEASKIIAQNTGAGTLLIWQQRADDANQEAAGYATAARASADDADAQADAAEAAAAKAMAARTDYDNAKMKATVARTAANAAEAAAMAAETAATTASDALAMATADGATVAVAREQSNVARTAAMGAAGKPAEANTGYMDAKAASGEAKKAADVHVIGLLKTANAVGVNDTTSTVDEQAVAAKAVRDVIGEAAGKTTDPNNDSFAITGNTNANVKAKWDADTPASKVGETAAKKGMLSITVTSGRNAEKLDFRTADDPTDAAKKKTATKIDGLPGFMYGYEISDSSTHALVFTDKKQATAKVAAKMITLVNHPVQVSGIVEIEAAKITKLSDLDMQTKYDHDGDPDTLAVKGNYTCATGSNCVVQITDNEVVGITGTVLFKTVAAQPIVAEVAANPMNDYLAFGVWLYDDNGDNKPDFGAFAGGGTEFKPAAVLVGTATYSGTATGVYTAGRSVDYFQGNATLNADFGKVDAAKKDGKDEGFGTITGMIDSIAAGGNDMSDIINLNGGAIVEDGSFSGNARMGAVTVKDDAATYTHNGRWSGQFYGPAAKDDAKGVDTLPPAAAGTFGVTGTTGEGDAAVTRSYVGAFGARR